MARQINIGLNFKANTAQAKNAITQLQNSLNQLNTVAAAPNIGKQMAKELTQASNAAAQLKVQIESATNVDTGRLDLGKFNQALEKSGMTLQQYAQSLRQLGPAGEQAFSQLGTVIMQAEIPVLRLNKSLTNLKTTLFNTLRWQVSAAAIQGVASAISSAYNYTKDLNKSLNEIRIVTGKSTEDMASFAVEANKAAKALSTTTNEYAKGSLIYYQQGLSDAEVKKRTDVTVKLANVTRNSANDVSNWMTAIWNNFSDGSDNLERYADVLTRLGATTASSSEEIATGMEKFAAVADTVGLSFDNAAAALATITATTRQSADVVGTSLKTLFSRMEQLKLGETLDDGTTLGQYSQALAKVGVDIKDASGELKSMDTIIEETGLKWQTLGKDQQVALAQQVAGVRQYQQFIALMDNFDFYQKNVSTAQNATGELEKQNEIYAESWEAASKRVKAAAESIYGSILDDKFFIKLTDSLGSILEYLNNVIKAMGGVPGLLSTISALVLKFNTNKILGFFDKAKLGLQSLTATGRQKIVNNISNQYTEAAKQFNIPTKGSSVEAMRFKATQDQWKVEEALARNAGKYSEEEERILKAKLEMLKVTNEQRLAEKEEIENAKKYLETSVKRVRDKSGLSDSSARTYVNAVKKDARFSVMGEELANASTQEEAKKIALRAKEQYAKGGVLTGAGSQWNATEKILSKLIQDLEEGTIKAEEFQERLAGAGSSIQKFAEQNNRVRAQRQSPESNNNLRPTKVTAEEQQGIFTNAITASRKPLKETKEAYEELLDEANNPNGIKSWGGVALNAAQGFSTLAMAVSSFKGIWDTIIDPDMSTWEKMISIITSLGITISMVDAGIPGVVDAFNAAKNLLVKGKGEDTLASLADTAAEKSLAKAKKETANASMKEAGAVGESAAAKGADAIANELDENDFTGADGTRWFTKKSADGKTLHYKDGHRTNKTTYDMGFKEAQKAGQAAKEGGKALEEGGQAIEAGGEAVEVGGKEVASGASSLAKGGIIVAAIIIAIASIYGAIKYFNKERDDAIEANKVAEGMGEQFDKAKSSYDDLKNSMSSYQDAVNGLKALKKGTAEFTEGVMKANEEAMKMIENYSELSGKYHFDKNGVIQFDEGALEEAQASQLGQMQMANMGKLQADIEAERASLKAEIVEFNRNKLEDRGWDDDSTAATLAGGGVGLAAGMGIGGTVGSTAGPVGAAVGAAIGLIAGLATTAVGAAIADYASTDQEEEVVQKLADLYKEQGDIAFRDSESFNNTIDELVDNNSSLAESLKENASEVRDLAAKITETNELIRTQNQQQMQTYLESRKDLTAYQDLDDELKGTMADILGNSSNKSYWEEQGKEIADDLDDEEIQKAYAKLNGLKFISNDNGKGTFLGKDGKEFQIDDSVTREFIASQIALSKGAEDAAKVRDALNSASVKGKELGKNLADGGEYLGQQLAKSLSEEGLEGLKSLTAEEANAIIDEVNSGSSLISDKDAAAAGFATAQAYADEVVNYLHKNWNSDEAETLRAQADKAKFDDEIAGGAAKAGVSDTALKSYAQHLMAVNEAFQDNEIAAAKAASANALFSKGVDKLNEALSKNASILAQTGEKGLDYYEAIGEIQTALKDIFGADVSFKFVQDNIEDIQNMANLSAESLDKLRKKAGEDYISNLALGEEDMKKFKGAFDEIANANVNIGENFNDEKYIGTLNEMLEKGKITVDQMNAAFGTMGFEPDIGYKEIDTENVSTIDGIKVGPVSLPDLTFTTHAKTQVPYIKGANTSRDGAVNGSGLMKVTSGSSMQSALSSSAKHTGGDDASKKKNANEEIDRYHKINAIISDTNRELERYSKLKDKAYGKERLAYMDKEIKKNKELLVQQKQKTQEALNYLKSDAAYMKGYGAKLDDQGRITNYEELMRRQIAKYNANPDANGDVYEQFKNDLSRYEETLETYKDSLDSEMDLWLKDMELRLAKIQYKVEVRVELDDYELKYLEYRLEQLNKTKYGKTESLLNIAKQLDNAMDKSVAYEEGVNDILKDIGLNAEETQKVLAGDTSVLKGKTITADQIKQLQDYGAALLDINKTIDDTKDKLYDQLTKSFEEFNKELETNAKKLESNNKLLQNLKNIIDLIGRKSLGVSQKSLGNLYDAIYTNSTKQVAATKNALEANKEAMKQAQDGLAAAQARGDDEIAIQKWQDQIQAIADKTMSLEDQLGSKLQEAINAAKAAFENASKGIIEAFQESLGGIYSSLDDIQDFYNRQKTLDSEYLKPFEKAYEINKLNRQINESINKTDNLKGQRMLGDMQKTLLGYQEDGADLSKEELGYLQKKYDLLLAQIALEESANAKSTVRMIRDSEGNYGYQYTADQANIDKAQQNYEDKLYELQKYQTDTTDAGQAKFLSVAQSVMKDIGDIRNRIDLSPEQKNKLIAELEDYLLEEAKINGDKMSEILANSADANELFTAKLAEDYNDLLFNKVFPGYNTFTDLTVQLSNGIQDCATQMSDAWDKYHENSNLALEAAGYDVNDFGKVVDNTTKKVEADDNQLMEDNEKLAKNYKDNYKDIVDTIKDLEDKYNSHVDTMKSYNSQIATSIGSIGEAAIKMAKTLNNKADDAESALKRIQSAAAKASGVKTTLTPQEAWELNKEPKTLNQSTVTFGKNVTTRVGKDGKTYYQTNSGTWVQATELSSKNTEGKSLLSHRGNISATSYIGQTVEYSGKQNNDYISLASIKPDNNENIGSMLIFPDGNPGDSRVASIPFAKYYDHEALKNSKVDYYYASDDGSYAFHISQGIGTSNKSSKDAKSAKEKDKTHWLTLHELSILLGKQDRWKSLDDVLKDFPVLEKKYAKGGLVDFTGPAWVDGTKQDPEAFLSAKDTRLISALTLALRQGALGSVGLSDLTSNGIAGTIGKTSYQQEVTINASFPNAKDHLEIEEAFNNLIGKASQYANRK